MLHWAIKNYVIPFLGRVKHSKLFCSFKEDNIIDQNNVIDDNDDEPLIPPYFFGDNNVSFY